MSLNVAILAVEIVHNRTNASRCKMLYYIQPDQI